MKVRLAAITVIVLLVVSLGGALGLSDQGGVSSARGAEVTPQTTAAADACAKLRALSAKGLKIVSATTQIAGAPVAGVKVDDYSGTSPEGVPLAGLPEFCRVIGAVSAGPGSNIGFEVWLPTTGWDGRLNGVGVGSFAGFIDHQALAVAVKAGQASVSTDTGHVGRGQGWLAIQDSAWAKGHPERVRDYGSRGVHLSAVAAKQIIQAFYGRKPDRAYFIGCSGGGREGLMEASRYPQDYDGIIAGAPAASLSDIAIIMSNSVQAQMAPGAAIRPEQASLLEAEVVRQCDAGDGVVDGLIADPRRCRLDLTRLTCGVSHSAQCFTPPQIAALRRIYAGPRDRSGRPLASAYLPGGSEAVTSWAGSGWGAILKGAGDAPSDEVLADGLLLDLVQGRFGEPETFNFDTGPQGLRAVMSKDIDVAPDLTRFFDRGGKVILWHGWADQAIPPEQTLHFYAAVLRRSGASARAASRLYMVPGVQHCMGGNGPASFGQLSPPLSGDTPENSLAAALQAWVEEDREPKAMIARFEDAGQDGPTHDRQRLLCPWPAEAMLRKGAEPNRAISYSCVTRPAGSDRTQSDRLRPRAAG